jgi:hypothetical protein
MENTRVNEQLATSFEAALKSPGQQLAEVATCIGEIAVEMTNEDGSYSKPEPQTLLRFLPGTSYPTDPRERKAMGVG